MLQIHYILSLDLRLNLSTKLDKDFKVLRVLSIIFQKGSFMSPKNLWARKNTYLGRSVM